MDLTSRTWARLSWPVLVRLKLDQVTYRVPSGPENGCENWFRLQVPRGVGRPKVLPHSALVELTSTRSLKVSP